MFTAGELALVQDDWGEPQKIKRLTGRFAVKEALVKALGSGFAGGIGFKDIETLSEASGKPVLWLHGRAWALAEELGISEHRVSISYSRQL